MQVRGDTGVASSGRDLPQHVEFARRQVLQGRGADPGPAADERLDHLRVDQGTTGAHADIQTGASSGADGSATGAGFGTRRPASSATAKMARALRPCSTPMMAAE